MLACSPALRLRLAGRPVPLGADALAVHHSRPDRCLAEADLPAAHGKDQAGAGELPALRAGGGAGARRPGHLLQQAFAERLLYARPGESRVRAPLCSGHRGPGPILADVGPRLAADSSVTRLGTELPGPQFPHPVQGVAVLIPRLTELPGLGPGPWRVSDGVTFVLRVKWGWGAGGLSGATPEATKGPGWPWGAGSGLECGGPRARL